MLGVDTRRTCWQPGTHDREQQFHAMHAIPIEVRMCRLERTGTERVTTDDFTDGTLTRLLSTREIAQ